jgi:hypothetical protein
MNQGESKTISGTLLYVHSRSEPYKVHYVHAHILTLLTNLIGKVEFCTAGEYYYGQIVSRCVPPNTSPLCMNHRYNKVRFY